VINGIDLEGLEYSKQNHVYYVQENQGFTHIVKDLEENPARAYMHNYV
jgi:hypothetical protein